MSLIAVPNVSEGADAAVLDAIVRAFTANGTRLLGVHSDADHGRTVFTLAGEPGRLADALAQGAREAAERIDLTAHAGAHPHVGALDVAPVVFLEPAQRPAALAEALLAAALIGERVPVFLYGLLAQGRTRAELRRGGVRALAERVAQGVLAPDFAPWSIEGVPATHSIDQRAAPSAIDRHAGPAAIDQHAAPSAIDRRTGAVLVAARPPLIAFNLELAPPATRADARAVAAMIREGGPDGLPGLRAIGLELAGGVPQVSMNVEDHLALPLAAVVAAVERRRPVAAAEVVGLPPAAAFVGYPDGLPTRGRRTLEDALADGEAGSRGSGPRLGESTI